MPEKATVAKAKQALRKDKKPTTAAGEFVREEIEHIRRGQHGARSTRQAIAIGLSKARRAGVPLRPPKQGQTSERTRRSAEHAYEAGQRRPSAPSRKRSKATRAALKREPRRAVSKRALSAQAKRAARKRGSKTAATSSAPRRWSGAVTRDSHALEVEDRVFLGNPREMARSLKRSAERSTSRKSSPFRSAMSMLNFYENRAGRNLPPSRKQAIRQAKQELRKLYGKPAQ